MSAATDACQRLRAERDELRAKVRAVEALCDPDEMERAMWRASGLREDLLPLAALPAALALRAALGDPS